MNIHGLNKLTLLDYPGKVAATVFFGNCNFRCPFCHNKDLVLDPKSQPVIPAQDVLDLLKKRQGILEGVCITGGEPTLSPYLESFLLQIKELDYAIKLDTNGTRPDILKHLVKEGLVDMVAMDIKSSKEGYKTAAGVENLDMDAIAESAFYLLEGNVSYEFRTTVVKELHNRETFRAIGQWIAGCEGYFLQAYKDSDTVICPGFHTNTKEELEEYRQLLLETIPIVGIRGID